MKINYSNNRIQMRHSLQRIGFAASTLFCAWICEIILLPQVSAEVAYPLLQPQFAYAHHRHEGETSVGSVGTVNKRADVSVAALTPIWDSIPGSNRGYLRFRYEFRSSDPEEFVGLFLSLGRIGIATVLPDGMPGPDLDLHGDGTFNFRQLSALAGDPVSIEAIRFALRPDGSANQLTIRAELEDKDRRKMFARFAFDSRGAGIRTITLPLSAFGGTIDLTAVKLVTLVIEESHFVDGVTNPAAGGFDIAGISLVDQNGSGHDAAALTKLQDLDFVRELARAEFETLWRLTDAKTGFCLDRTLYRDLIAISGTGWFLAALPEAVKLRWITEKQAEERALLILRFADQDSLWGDEPSGKLGNSRGIMYRFLGIDPNGLFGPLTGTRKIDQGRVNAVEASTIDTSIFQVGALTLAARMPKDTPNQREIRQRVQSLLNRTRWNELIDPRTGQFMMAWKPQRDDAGPGFFTVPAAFGGYWASRNAQGTEALPIDYWSSEGVLASWLATGSEAHPVDPAVWYRMIRQVRTVAGKEVVLFWPGAWFGYAFHLPFLNPQQGLDQGANYGTRSTDWMVNSANAFDAYRALSPQERLVLPDAIELPNIRYEAQALPSVAVNANAFFTGTVSLDSLEMAIGLGGPRAVAAIAELKRLLTERPELWHPLFGLADSYHPDLAGFPDQSELIRNQGPWIQQQKWPLNCGAGLLATLNFIDDGAIWRTATSHPVMQRALDAIYRPVPVQDRSEALEVPGANDAWGAAMGESGILIVDSYQEVFHLYDQAGGHAGRIDSSEIAEVLTAAGIFVERSSGPAGVRAAASLPDGGFVVLLAGPGANTLLRVRPDRTLSVISSSFGDAMTRGDEIWNWPRIAVGGSPSAILVTVRSPQQGIAVVGVDGKLKHTLPLNADYFGVAVESGGNRLYLLRSDGAIESYENLYDPALKPQRIASLPSGVGGRDLAFNSRWRTQTSNLIAVGNDGNVYSVSLVDKTVTRIDKPGFQGAVALAVDGGTLVLANDESAWIDQVLTPSAPIQLRSPSLSTDRTIRFVITGTLGHKFSVESSIDLKSWQPFTSGVIEPSGTEIRDGLDSIQKFYRAKEQP